MGVAARYEHASPHFFNTRHIVTNSATELHSLMKIFLMVFKTEGIVANSENMKVMVVILVRDISS